MQNNDTNTSTTHTQRHCQSSCERRLTLLETHKLWHYPYHNGKMRLPKTCIWSVLQPLNKKLCLLSGSRLFSKAITVCTFTCTRQRHAAWPSSSHRTGPPLYKSICSCKLKYQQLTMRAFLPCQQGFRGEAWSTIRKHTIVRSPLTFYSSQSYCNTFTNAIPFLKN